MLYFQWPPAGSISTTGIATEAKQDAQIVLQTATNTKLDSTNTKLDTLHTDVTATNAKIDSANTTLTSIDTKVATAANQTTANSSLSSIDTKLSSQATAANQTTLATLTGAVTETAPASDTASSGLNGRLQRIAQRLTSLIALLPASLGQKTSANSLAVTIASDQSAVPVSGTFWQATQPVSGTVTANAGTGTFATSATQSGTWTIQPGNTANTTPWLTTSSRTSANAPTYMDYSSTNVTTSAYVQLVASTTSAIKKLNIFSSTGETLYLATGAAASEVNQIMIPPGGQGDVELAIAAGTRISVKSASATASVGVLVISYFT